MSNRSRTRHHSPPESLSSAIVGAIVLSGVVGLSMGNRCDAQDFRVVTKVSQWIPETGEWSQAARSLTLFHAGKVYDKVEEIGEVVIFEPLHNRFVILSSNDTGTVVHREELLQFLQIARAETTRYLGELQTRTDENSRAASAVIRSQLDPEFGPPQFDPSHSGRLQLLSRAISYDVKTETVEQPQVVDEYLQYADWAARLNHVLHPQSLFPAPRIALNQVLRERQRIPVEVNLRIAAPEEVRLKAEHRFEWKLQDFDKADIRNWEQIRESSDVRWLNFRDYQRELLASLADRRNQQ